MRLSGRSCSLLFVCAQTLCIPTSQILNFPGSYFSLNRHVHNSRKWSGPGLRAARRGGLLGWLKWNGFAMVTAGKGQEKEAFGQAAVSEQLLIKRHCEALGTKARIYSPANERGVASAWLVK